jgi:hypothetical protein
MGAIFSYKCACCDKVSEGSPSLAFKRPDHWLQQSEAVRAAGFADDDVCWYEDEDGMHYFIRTILEIPIHGVEDPFLWGVWVSLSKTSYQRYLDTYDARDLDDAWFGYLCSALPGYPSTWSLPVTVRPCPSGLRPLVSMNSGEHALVTDSRDGISVARAQALAESILHR